VSRLISTYVLWFTQKEKGDSILYFEKEMELFANNIVVDWHEHVYFNEGTDQLNVEHCDWQAKMAKHLHIDRMMICWLTTKHVAPEYIEKINNMVNEAVQRHPDLYFGFCFVDPHHGRYAVAEIERCVSEYGFKGVKLYHQCRMDDPLQYPIIEKCIDLDIPILMHAGGRGTSIFFADQPNLADSRQFAAISRLYPEAVFQMGHIGGGGDWSWQLKGISECNNVFIDISGSIYDQGIVEATVATFGAGRVLFGADGSYASSVGKLLGAEISEQEKVKILNGTRFKKYIDKEGMQ